MDTNLRLIPTSLLAIASAFVALSSTGLATDEVAKSIPFNQFGAEAGKNYKGSRLANTPLSKERTVAALPKN